MSQSYCQCHNKCRLLAVRPCGGVCRLAPQPFFVVEASPEKGVVKTPWREFLNRSGGGVVVKRLDADYPKQEAVERVLAHLGQPYDWYYLPGNGRTYYSELVEESYLYADSTRIFPQSLCASVPPTAQCRSFGPTCFIGLGQVCLKESRNKSKRHVEVSVCSTLSGRSVERRKIFSKIVGGSEKVCTFAAG